MSTVADMPDAEYFAHPALSHSDTKLLADSPARYRYAKDHPDRPYKPEFEFGHAVHELALRKGPGIVVIDATDWKKTATRDERDAALANGQTPCLVHEYEAAVDCANSLRRHPVAANLLDHLDHTEIACFWDDNGVERKAKLDGVAGRWCVDVKTTPDASTASFGRSAGKYRYASQNAWYLDAMRACFGVDDPGFLFLVVEKYPPYLVNVIQLDSYDVELGGRENRRLIDLYRQCRDTNTWPAYGDGINTAQLPRWAELEMESA